MLLGREPGDVAQELVDAQEAQVEIEQRQPDRGILVERPDLAEAGAGLALALQQLLLDLLAGRDVDVDAGDPGRRARALAHALAAGEDPAHGAVRQHHPELGFVGAGRGEEPVLVLLDPLAVVRMDARQAGGDAHRLAGGKPVKRLEGRRRDDRVGAGVPFEGERAAELLGALQPGLGRAERRLDPHPLGDVDRDAGEAPSLDRVRDMRPHPRPADLAARPADAEDDVGLVVAVAGGLGHRPDAAGVGRMDRIENALGRDLAAPFEPPEAARDVVGGEAVARQVPRPQADAALRQRLAELRIGPRTAGQAVDILQCRHGDLRSGNGHSQPIPTSAEVIENKSLESENRTRTRLAPPGARYGRAWYPIRGLSIAIVAGTLPRDALSGL